MAFKPAWRNFKRMQDIMVAAACLIYAAAVVFAMERAHGATGDLVRWTLIWPAPWLIASLAAPLMLPPLRRGLSRYVWMSFEGGFGQTPGSVLFGAFLLFAVAVFFYLRATSEAVAGFAGPNVFAAYAAGIGILAAQAILVRSLEQDPQVRRQIEDREG